MCVGFFVIRSLKCAITCTNITIKFPKSPEFLDHNILACDQFSQ